MQAVFSNIFRKQKSASSYTLPRLPFALEIESRIVLKKSNDASRALAELKGFCATIPNQIILLNTLSLQEAKDSSAIENIITTHDELYQSDVRAGVFASLAAKEVHCYASALRDGFEEVKATGLLTNNLILRIQEQIEGNKAGFRTQAGTALKNEQTGEIIYTPPQEKDAILRYMGNLQDFINTPELCDWDPLIKMAVIHHQFESIHPFFDGNGRTGRIINILYLVQQGLLDTPVLYLSRYINQNKGEYYRLLQAVREQNSWEEWLLFMLEGIYLSADQVTGLIKDMRTLLFEYKNKLRNQKPKVYSQDLLNNLFSHPYTKIAFLESALQIHRNTAARYLDELVDIGLMTKHKIGKENFYLNDALFELLHNVGARPLT